MIIYNIYIYVKNLLWVTHVKADASKSISSLALDFEVQHPKNYIV